MMNSASPDPSIIEATGYIFKRYPYVTVAQQSHRIRERAPFRYCEYSGVGKYYVKDNKNTRQVLSAHLAKAVAAFKIN